MFVVLHLLSKILQWSLNKYSTRRSKKQPVSSKYKTQLPTVGFICRHKKHYVTHIRFIRLLISFVRKKDTVLISSCEKYCYVGKERALLGLISYQQDCCCRQVQGAPKQWNPDGCNISTSWMVQTLAIVAAERRSLYAADLPWGGRSSCRPCVGMKRINQG